jgi:hypothetical protein
MNDMRMPRLKSPALTRGLEYAFKTIGDTQEKVSNDRRLDVFSALIRNMKLIKDTLFLNYEKEN